MEVNTQYSQAPVYSVGPSGDNEAVERAPDNESAEMAAKSSGTPDSYGLPNGVGENINILV